MAKRDKDDDRPDEDAAKGGDASSADAGKGSGEGGGTAPTLLPPVPTRCPMIPTKCPEIPRLCAQDDAALAGGTAAFPTLPITAKCSDYGRYSGSVLCTSACALDSSSCSDIEMPSTKSSNSISPSTSVRIGRVYGSHSAMRAPRSII